MSAGNKKRKRDESAGDQPTKVRVVDQEAAGTEGQARGKSRQEKSERRSKKASSNNNRSSGLLSGLKGRLKNVAEVLTPDATPQNQVDDSLANGEDFVSLGFDTDSVPRSDAPKSSKKDKNKNKKVKAEPKAEEPAAHTSSSPPTANNESKKDRFILFIGNLPYAATTETITNHFVALQPFTVRHSTDKTTGKSKGYAFLEFENYDKMKTCLQLYHHSMFDPDAAAAEIETKEKATQGKKRKDPNQTKTEKPVEKSHSKNARRINVELTAGGGGKGKERKEKIDQKNKKLAEERERRHVKENMEKANAAQGKKARPATGANADAKDDNTANIHPSRLERVKV